jgi:hypothetical protein
MRDIDRPVADACGRGEVIGGFVAVLVDHPLPWTRLRQIYKMFGFCRHYGNDPVELACARSFGR